MLISLVDGNKNDIKSDLDLNESNTNLSDREISGD